MDNFIFKDISSENFNIIVNSLPPISKPTMRVQETIIDGVDGSLIEELGYESYEKKIKITITKNNVDEIIKWLNGEGNLVLSNESDKYYKANVIGQINFERLMKYLPTEVTFRVQPFKYKLNEESIELTESGSVNNLGLEKSKPIIKIVGSGNVEFLVNDSLIFTYTFPEEDSEVIIDSEKEDAYLNGELKNRNMIGEFPVFSSGENKISWNGEITSITIEPKSRWL